LSHVQDLLPTLAELAGVAEVPKNLDGRSLAPVLEGRRDPLDDRMLVINYSRMPSFKVKYTSTPAIPAREGAGVLWKRWRLLEDRELYDLDSDPHQDRDVAAEHPEVVAKMRAHLDRWWDGVKETVMEPERVVIGNDADNPTLLSACEWLDVFVDQQRQIRHGDLKNGTWHLIVDRPGTYRFELRRWPREAAHPLSEGLPVQNVTDGQYIAGVAIPIASARLRIGPFDSTRQPDPSGCSVTFETELRAGPADLDTGMLDASGQPICGAYYVYVWRK
jgi:hypothetical protein